LSGEELYRLFVEKEDNGAFELLVGMYADELGRYINSIVRDYHESRHMTIEVFAKLAEIRGQFEGRSSIKTYLFTIGRNMAFRHLKTREKENHIPFDEIIGIYTDDSGDPYSIIERKETEARVREALKSLKYEQRAVIVLLYFDDMSYAQAAKAMGKSEKSIKSLAFRAKKSLRKILSKD